MKRWLLLCPALALAACMKLDPFLYMPERVASYVFAAAGDSPEETVDPAQLHPFDVTADDGALIKAIYVDSTEQPPRGYVVFFHGKGGNLDTTMPRLKRYANLGYDTIGFDYRGWGASSDIAPTEAGIAFDGQAIVSAAKGRFGMPADRLFYAGQSFGTASATQATELAPSRALVIESGFASLAEFARESTQMDVPQSFYSKDTWDTASRLAGIHVPVLILHGSADAEIRYTHAEINYAAANEPKLLHIEPGGGHADLPEVMGQRYADLIHSFVAPTLAPP